MLTAAKLIMKSVNMFIEIESVYGDSIVHGKRFDKDELRDIVNKLLTLVGEQEFTSAFCAEFGYCRLPYSDCVKVDYIIDLDTHLIINPEY